MPQNTGRLGKLSMKKEITWGTAVTPDTPLSVYEESLVNQVEHIEDNRFIGEVFPSNMIKVGENAQGGASLTIHPNEAAKIFEAGLGKSDSAVYAPSGILIVTYVGSNAYSSISVSSGTMEGKSGADSGSASQDWSFDTSNASYDTLTELSAAIEAVTDWKSTYVGYASGDTGNISDFSETEMSGAMFIDVRSNGLSIQYSGSNASALVNMTSGSIEGKSGASGSESQDWIFDTSNASYDTLTEVQAAIDAVADWSCSLVGAAATDSGTIDDFTDTDTKTSALFVGCGSAKKWKIYNGGATDDMPSYTFYIDRTLGTGKAFSYSGVKVNTMQISFSTREIIRTTLDLVGKLEGQDETYPSLTIPEDAPFVTGQAKLIKQGYVSSKIKDFSISVNNNLDVSGLVGTLYIDEPIRGASTIEVSGSANLDVTEWERDYPKFTQDDEIEIILALESTSNADTGENIPYMILIRLAQVKLTEYQAPMSGPDRITTSFNGSVVNSVDYEHIEIYVVDTNTSLS